MTADEKDLLTNLEDRVKILERDLTHTAEQFAALSEDIRAFMLALKIGGGSRE